MYLCGVQKGIIINNTITMKKETFKRLLETATIDSYSDGRVIISHQEEDGFYFEYYAAEDWLVDEGSIEVTDLQREKVVEIAREHVEGMDFPYEDEGPIIDHYDEYGVSPSDFI